MELRDFVDYRAAYAWATGGYLRRLFGSDSMRLSERVSAAYPALAADGPRAFAAPAWALRSLRS